MRREIKGSNIPVDINVENLKDLKDFLHANRPHLQRFLENPNLFEHDSFSLMLRSLYHLVEELGYRVNLEQLPESDIKHLENDIKRAYISVLFVWLNYLEHLNQNFDYMFSLAIRTNPFVSDISVVITDEDR
ncbi:hypothetical protein SYNTR_0178 [Candidatus Syntrophocurvum alkaliphilum]|uniref:Uncharacterized protein n=1 Tax=Candidatus Syntrophocurvum alkaliphilum TaxID=2293317 RepID=A0A6I6DE19_9FIRM|nr:hypothetical protein [Candidatus Syntrophocurvum alkaliphilum]QGT98771.1 hypothetical protein SYNTR_0178 [Candidatus Syntrophocurvum alkaliphilum]